MEQIKKRHFLETACVPSVVLRFSTYFLQHWPNGTAYRVGQAGI